MTTGPGAQCLREWGEWGAYRRKQGTGVKSLASITWLGGRVQAHRATECGSPSTQTSPHSRPVAQGPGAPHDPQQVLDAGDAGESCSTGV